MLLISNIKLIIFKDDVFLRKLPASKLPVSYRIFTDFCLQCSRAAPVPNEQSSGQVGWWSVVGNSLILKLYSILYNLYKDSCPLIGRIAFIISTIYSIRWQNILLHSVRVGKRAKNIYYCTQHSHFHLSTILGWNSKLYARKMQQAQCVV